jgi:diaminohydroxyphosphoribosylaminopyrimidine deaminase/5-amino-6-(5-phosphoribosylamino)uracil reductase
MTSQDDIYHMRSALALARTGLGRTWPNPSVGCVIVDRHGHVVGRGRTADDGRPHAEAAALAQAGHEAKGGTAYVTLEPCANHGRAAPCTGYLIEAGIARVVFAHVDPNPAVNGQGMRQLHAAGIEVETGVLEVEALEMNAGFINRITRSRPFVTLKSAVSIDGKIAEQKGKRTYLSGELSLQRVHLERAKHDAVLAGIGTVLIDDPLLTARVQGLDHRTVRVVLDSSLRIPLDSQLVRSANDYRLWIFHRDDPEDKAGTLEKAGVKLFKDTDVKEVCARLAEEKLTRLFVEGGAEVQSSFLKAGMCDRFLLFRTKKSLGSGGVDALAGHKLDDLSGKFGLKLRESRSYGEDLLEIYARQD